MTSCNSLVTSPVASPVATRVLPQTTYEIKHEATVAGVHRIHICLGELPILGSPLSFFVQPDRPEPSLCKLYPPQVAVAPHPCPRHHPSPSL